MASSACRLSSEASVSRLLSDGMQEVFLLLTILKFCFDIRTCSFFLGP